MPEMETKFPDYTGKLTAFAVNKLMVIRYNCVNFFFFCFVAFCVSLYSYPRLVKLVWFFILQVAYLKFDTFS